MSEGGAHTHAGTVQKPPENGQLTGLCCGDVWKNLIEGEGRFVYRICTEEEKFKISIRKVVAKQIVSLVLLAFVVWFISIEVNSTRKRATLFDCDASSPNSFLVVEQDVVVEFPDGGISYCYFKSSMIVIAFVFLIPFLMEILSILSIILVSSVNVEVLIPLSEEEYCGYDGVFDGVLSPNPFVRLFKGTGALLLMPYTLVVLARRSEAGRTVFDLGFEILWKFSVFMLPDFLLTVALFPVAYFVMQSSDNVAELFVNLVAVQIFAQLDEMFVKMTLRPRTSVGEAIKNYVSGNPHVQRAKYRPLQEYELALNRHDWGLKVPGDTRMKEIHEYNGFHFIP